MENYSADTAGVAYHGWPLLVARQLARAVRIVLACLPHNLVVALRTLVHKLMKTFGFAFLTALLFATSTWAGSVEMNDGVPHVHNGTEPSEGISTLQLREVWRIGGDDEETFFGVIMQVQTDSEGNLYLLDQQLSQVFVYSPDGQLLRTLSRAGEGPGEVRRPEDLVLLPDGTVGIVQNSPGKVVRITRDDVPVDSVTISSGDPAAGGFYILHAGKSRGGQLVLGGVRVRQGDGPAKQKRTDFVSTFDLAGNELVCYHKSEYVFDFENFHFSEPEIIPWFQRRCDLDDDGFLYAAPERDAYSISVFAQDGSLVRVIDREYKHLRRTPHQKQELIDLFSAELRQLPFEFEIEVGDYEPDIAWIQNGLRVAPDGTLWVLSSRGTIEQPAGIMQTYDIFDRDGHYARQVQVACEGDGQRDYLFFSGTQRIILVTGFIDALRAALGGGTVVADENEAAPMEVVCFEIVSGL